jgi:amino acid adenylation domain-containing protein
VRFALVKVADGSSILAITAHHIITDGWTVRLLFQDIVAAYKARGFGQPAFSITRPDYVAAVQRETSSLVLAELEPQFLYWRGKLAGVSGGTELTPDRTRPEIATYRGGRVRRLFGLTESHKLRSLVRTQHSSLFVVLLAAYQALLYRMTGQEDVTVGTVRAARSDSRFQDVAGLFVNLITIRTQLSGNMSFSDLLRIVQDNVLEAFENGDFPFEELVARLGVERSLNRTPFFQIAFAVHDRSITDTDDPNITLTVMEPDLEAAQYDLHLTIKERGEQIEAIWDYASELFDRETVEWIASSYENVMNTAAEDPSCACSDLALLSASQVDEIVHGWNAPCATQIPSRQPAVYSIEARAAARSDSLAVVFGPQKWTHRELDQRVNRLAYFLIGLGVGKGDRVALSFDRCFEMIVAMLAIQKAGAAYVPIDPAYPPDRIAYIAEQAHARMLLASEQLRPILETCKCPILALDSLSPQLSALPDTPPDRRAEMDAVAYVIFTSGSTGQPKGVEIEHRSLANLAYAQAELCKVTADSRTLQFSPLGFDASVWEIFPTLAVGGCIVLGERFDLMPGPGLARLMREQQVTHATLPPSALRILPEDDLPDLKVVISAGEACSLELAKRWANGHTFINAYGPTETTVCACAGVFDPADDRPPSIGRPLANMKLFVFDSRMQPVPPGVVGELYVGGAGVARGYVGRPDLTAERFLPNPFSPGERLYRTGDMVRYRPDRNVEYVGRADSQVKLRGFRIELGEIESVIHAEEGVVDAVVLVEHDRDETGELVAYLTASEPASQALVARVSERLGRYLPSYMRPKHIFVVDRIPLTPNGKVDRKALRRPPLPAAASAPAALPQSKLEKQIVDIWSAVLDHNSIDIDGNFFDLGGHSLKMTQVHVRLEQALGCTVPIVTLFQHPTVRALARALAQANGAGASGGEASSQRQLKDGAERLSRLAALRSSRQAGTMRADGS